MKKYSPEQYKKIFEKLPKEIQDAVLSYETAEKIWQIAQNHKLQIDQSGNLQDIVLDVMMGITATKNFIKTLADELKISTVDAGAIARDIDEQIFKPIKEIMIKIYADTAPFKLNTMQTVGENDEDHSNLDKDEILREIENPTIHERRTVNLKESAPTTTKTPSIKISDSKVLEEYHEEIEPKEAPKAEKDLRSNTPTGISSVEESKKRLLESIASKKLDSIFTMPKVDLREGNLPPKIENNTVSSKITPQSKDLTQKENSVSTATSKPDPYREPIN